MRGAARRRCGDDRGAAVVEFALVLPVLMILLLGMVSGASAWNQNQALGQGARVGARHASTLPLPAGWTTPLPIDKTAMKAWLDSIATRAVGAAEGQLGVGTDGREVCVAYVDPGTAAAADGKTARRTEIAGVVTYGYNDTDFCFDDGQGSAPRVQVVLRRGSYLDIGFHRQDLVLQRTVVYRYEAVSGL